MQHLLFSAAFAILLLGGQALQAEPIYDCVTGKNNARPICGFKNPEDMVALPGNQAILLGEYSHTAAVPGRLVLFELESEKQHTLYRGGQGKDKAEKGWGDPNCTTPPGAEFSAHGLDLVRRDDGRLQLLVIQHGSREAIELFEVMGKGTAWQVEWRGCVAAPANASLNGIAGMSNGDFYTTQMTPLDYDFAQGIPGGITGHAFAWSQAAQSYRKIEGTDGALPNGIVISPDGRYIYMNATAENSVRKIEVATGRELGRAIINMPDNARWASDGRIVIASFSKEVVQHFAMCLSLTRGSCRTPFSIVALDPESMAIETLYKSDGVPMGSGTVGLRIGDELFVGSATSDRILRVDISEQKLGALKAPVLL